MLDARTIKNRDRHLFEINNKNRCLSLFLLFKRVTAFITLVAFTATTLGADYAWAARPSVELASVGSDRAGGSGLIKEFNVETFALPEYLGRIKGTWYPSSTLRRSHQSNKGLA